MTTFTVDYTGDDHLRTERFMARTSTETKRPTKRAKQDTASSASSSDEIDGSTFEAEDASEDEEESTGPDVDSDAIDDSDAGGTDTEEEVATPKKRKSPTKTISSGGGTSKSTKVADLVAAPKKTAPAGQLSKSTFGFLRGLAAENEREWLHAHDAPYRHALNEFKAFVDALSNELTKADWTLPVLPAKDLVHRLARDIRFSADKTPYKVSFQASFSRTGRKGPYAGYFFMIQPGGKSMIAGGKWGPEKNELATIRTNILHKPKKIRRVLAEPAFVQQFGEPKPAGKGKRTSIFGREDELKNAPKLEGVDKTHKDIDLLKCKSFVVSKQFADEDMTSQDAVKKIGKVVEVMAPLVQLLNDMIMPQSDASESESSEEGSSERGGGDNE